MLRNKFFQGLRIVLSFALAGLPMRAYALPEGEAVVSGSATFNRAIADTLIVNQLTDSLIANYNSFSIAQNEAVNFVQPSAQSVALNRVVGVDPSAILGTLTANGRVFLVNPNGILFGQGCRVDTAGMVASTLDIADSDFLAGRYSFVDAGGSVVNQGYISSPGGFVALLGSNVENAGIIEAHAGSVALASGNAMTLEMDPKGFISVALEQPTYANRSEAVDAALNVGLIKANGGKVILTADVLNGIFDKAVNNEGIIEARSCIDRSGEVLLLAHGQEQTAANTGTIDVSAAGAARGGFVEISGENVVVDGIIDASSERGIPGELFIDPWDIRIVDKGRFDGPGGSTIGEWWLEKQNYSVTIQADNDVIFDLSIDNLLDLYKFDTATFTVKAGRHILLNDDAIATRGGDIVLRADYGCRADGIGTVNLGSGSGLATSGGDVTIAGADALISAPVVTSGGNVSILSKTGDIVHTAQGDVLTSGGDFSGNSARDYVLRNGASIATAAGSLVIQAQNDIILGSRDTQTSGTYAWQYVSDTRGYLFKEMGYYYRGEGGYIFVPVAQGYDIGKDCSSPRSGAGALPDDVTDIKLYTVFKMDYRDTWLTWYEDPALNSDGFDHVRIDGVRHGWEDMVDLGDADFDDAVFDFSKTFTSYGPGAFLSSDSLVSLNAIDGSITQNGGSIIVGKAGDAGLLPPEIVSSSPGVNSWSNDNTIDVAWKLAEPGAKPGAFIATAGRDFIMEGDAKIETNGADATIVAGDDAALTLIDAQTGDVSVTALNGNIIDNDKGVVNGNEAYPLQGDFDVIGYTIEFSASNGTVGGTDPGAQIDTGYPFANNRAGFSFEFSTADNTLPDQVSDGFTAVLGADGEWLFSATSLPLADSDSWHFHVATVDAVHRSPTVHYGPFLIDTTPPVIVAGLPTGTRGNLDWWLSDVTVPFSATDNLSGFAPDGSLSTDLDSRTTAGEGRDLIVTSDGVYDRAGNFAPGIIAGPFKVDQTPPVIAAGDPSGVPGPGGTWASDVTVPFSATDNLSGFDPDGALSTDMASEKTSGEGPGLTVTSDGIYDVAGNFAPGVSAGPFTVAYPAPPAPRFADGAFLDGALKYLRAYYEILHIYRFVSVEPATPTTFFSYRPLVPADFSAFDGIGIDEGAYDFIEYNLKLKSPLAPFFAEDADAKKMKNQS